MLQLKVKRIDQAGDLGERYAVIGFEIGTVIKTFLSREDAVDFAEHVMRFRNKEA